MPSILVTLQSVMGSTENTGLETVWV